MYQDIYNCICFYVLKHKFSIIRVNSLRPCMHICVGNLTIIGSDNDLSPGRRHYLNQCWNIVNWTPRNKLQWNINQNSYIFIQENPFENVVWKMTAILSQPQWFKGLYYLMQQMHMFKLCSKISLENCWVLKSENLAKSNQLYLITRFLYKLLVARWCNSQLLIFQHFQVLKSLLRETNCALSVDTSKVLCKLPGSPETQGVIVLHWLASS